MNEVSWKLEAGESEFQGHNPWLEVETALSLDYIIVCLFCVCMCTRACIMGYMSPCHINQNKGLGRCSVSVVSSGKHGNLSYDLQNPRAAGGCR